MHLLMHLDPEVTPLMQSRPENPLPMAQLFNFGLSGLEFFSKGDGGAGALGTSPRDHFTRSMSSVSDTNDNRASPPLQATSTIGPCSCRSSDGISSTEHREQSYLWATVGSSLDAAPAPTSLLGNSGELISLSEGLSASGLQHEGPTMAGLSTHGLPMSLNDMPIEPVVSVEGGSGSGSNLQSPLLKQLGGLGLEQYTQHSSPTAHFESVFSGHASPTRSSPLHTPKVSFGGGGNFDAAVGSSRPGASRGSSFNSLNGVDPLANDQAFMFRSSSHQSLLTDTTHKSRRCPSKLRNSSMSCIGGVHQPVVDYTSLLDELMIGQRQQQQAAQQSAQQMHQTQQQQQQQVLEGRIASLTEAFKTLPLGIGGPGEVPDTAALLEAMAQAGGAHGAQSQQQQLQALLMAAQMQQNSYLASMGMGGFNPQAQAAAAAAMLQAQAGGLNPLMTGLPGIGLPGMQMPGSFSSMQGLQSMTVTGMPNLGMLNSGLNGLNGGMGAMAGFPQPGMGAATCVGVSPAEMAAYYRGMMEAQAVMASALAAASSPCGNSRAGLTEVSKDTWALILAAAQQGANDAPPGVQGVNSMGLELSSPITPLKEEPKSEGLEKIDEFALGQEEEEEPESSPKSVNIPNPSKRRLPRRDERFASFSAMSPSPIPPTSRTRPTRSTSHSDMQTGPSPLQSPSIKHLAPQASTDRSSNSGPKKGDSGNLRDRNQAAVAASPESTDPVLEEFKSGKSGCRFELEDIIGHVAEFSLDQHGSRFIQQKLETASEVELGQVLAEVLPCCLQLMGDVFGNYVVQKFLEHGTPSQRVQIAHAMKGNVLNLSLQMYGCRVIQKALEVLPVDAKCTLIQELEGQVMRCVRDQNGNHVVQKIVECVPTGRIQPLMDNLLQCVLQLSSHPFGCRVIQRILEHCQDKSKRAFVLDTILASTCQLSQDQYGNYVIQHVTQHGSQEERARVVHELAPAIVSMCMHKFASNVVEKCLVHCNATERDVLIKAMLGSGRGSGSGSASSDNELGMDGTPEGEDPLQQMMKDQFGNYVVQKVLEVCNEKQREILLARVRAQLHALKRYTYGKHIVARVEKLLSTGTRLQTSNKSRLLPDDTEIAAMMAAQSATSSSPARKASPTSEPAAGEPTQFI